ncbi:MAG: hypothetical protein JO186_01530 [Actinobacteria bacterium]|nr:hypothetical protein [Actinomycetota bacterium]MBV8479180.1 hypothetical protein [Actinomycetota bacterium]
MSKFVYLYTGGTASQSEMSEEESKQVMQAWMDWLGAMGDHVIDVGNPFGASAAVNGGARANASGYTIVDAASLEEAVEHAKGCPIFRNPSGNVEVYEALAM